MIISVSRRTDIPAFYSEWFINRIREGFCLTPNPYNPKQVSRVDLAPDAVDAIVFWSKAPAPMMQHLGELERAGYRFYFQYTLNAYPQALEPGVPLIAARIATFKELAGTLGPQRVVWRYDPIIISNLTDWEFHARTFTELCAALAASTRRVMVSLLDMYARTERQFQALREMGVELLPDADEKPESIELLRRLAIVARDHGLEIFTCAERRDYSDIGIAPGRCIDGELMESLWGMHKSWRKDPGQRRACGCVVSKDIGVNDTCIHSCPYCYATGNPDSARARHAAHDPRSPRLFGESPPTPT